MADKPVVDVNGNLGKTVDNGGVPLTILQELPFRRGRGDGGDRRRSGSGKSTLLGLLAGLDVPSDGSIRLDGIALAASTRTRARCCAAGLLGFVFQSFQLVPSLTALENVMLPLELSGGQMRAARPLLGWAGAGRLASSPRHYPKHSPAASSSALRWPGAFALPAPGAGR